MLDLFSLLGYRRRWQLLSLFSRSPVSECAPVIIGGSERSGTTLLRVLLGRHPDIAGGPESTVFLPRISGPKEIGTRFGFDPETIEAWQRDSRCQIAFIERFQAAVLAAAGKSIWAEKTPENVRRFAFIRRHFPKARLIHIIRDGRDVVCSLRRHPWSRLRGTDPSSLEALRICADHWSRMVRAGRRMSGDPLYLEVRYEDLVRDPEPVLRRILDFLVLDWSECMLGTEQTGWDANELRARGPVFRASAGRWRQDLSSDELALLNRRIGQLLSELGYEPATVPPANAPCSPPRARAVPAGGTWRRRVARSLPGDMRALVLNARVLYQAALDRRVPWLARMAASLGIAYVASPIDLIPDHIPVIGYADDVAVVWIGLRIAAAVIPGSLLKELQSEAVTWLGLG